MSTTSRTSEPVLVAMSVLAGLQIFFAGSAATTVMVEASTLLTAVFAFGALAVGAAQVGIQFYVRGQVVPLDAVAERVADGKVIAGPANDILPVDAVVRDVGSEPVQWFTEPEPAAVLPENDGPDPLGDDPKALAAYHGRHRDQG